MPVTETLKIVENPSPWLQAGALGVLFALVLVIVLCVVVPMIGTSLWAIRYLVTQLTSRMDALVAHIAENTSVTQQVVARWEESNRKLDILIDALTCSEPPTPSSNGTSHHQEKEEAHP